MTLSLPCSRWRWTTQALVWICNRAKPDLSYPEKNSFPLHDVLSLVRFMRVRGSEMARVPSDIQLNLPSVIGSDGSIPLF